MREFDDGGAWLADYQGKLFEKSRERFSCSSRIFMRRFLHSDILKILDMNKDFLVRFTVDEALDEIEAQFGPSDYGKVQFPSESLYWMGYMYRYISYTRETDTRLLFKWFDYVKMNELYYVYHTQDPEWCIRNLLELNGMTEDIFDCNWRLKQAMMKKR